METYELSMLNKFDHIFVVSEVDKEIYLSKGLERDKIDVIPNGVDFDYFNSMSESSITLNHPNILFMGRLSYISNLVFVV
jgi:glycosyltransferase involved in cell wall biosynthesis